MPRNLSVVRSHRAKSTLSVLAGSVFALAAAFFGQGLVAQSLSLDNVPPIALTGSSSVSAVSIDPSTGNVTVRTQVGNYFQCSNQTQPPLDPIINSFSPSSSTVPPGGNITLSWTSSNTTSCSPQFGSGTNWPNFGVMGTSGSQSFVAPQSAGTISFQLTCTNGTQSVSQQTQVTVQQQTGGSCDPIFANGSSVTFAGAFGQAWPAYNDKIRQFVSNNQYWSASFTASASATQFGSINTTGFPQDGDGNGRVSISPSPGCFNASQLPANCVGAVAAFPGVSWTNGQSSFVCKLNPGQAYHLNFYFPDCPSGNCGRDFGNIQQLEIMDEASR